MERQTERDCSKQKTQHTIRDSKKVSERERLRTRKLKRSELQIVASVM